MSRFVSARKHIYRLTLDALFVALYFILSTVLSYKIPGLFQVSISTLPILLCAFLRGPVDAVAVAVVGAFLEQVIDPSPYGFATLPLWLIPGAVQALVASVGAKLIRRAPSHRMLEVGLCVPVIVLAELLLTALNTAVLYLDGYLLSHPVMALHALLPVRLANLGVRTLLSCILVPLLLPPLRRVLAKFNR